MKLEDILKLPPETKRIARVFPRRTSMSPTDELAFFDVPGLFPPEVDEVHVSVTWDYDIPIAERLFRAWQRIAPTKIGGPAIAKGEDFVPGIYLKDGIVVTSRGCPNRCWFCRVWRMDGDIRELPVTNGHNIIDDNLLACSIQHIQNVFDMLRRNDRWVIFSGGLDTKLFTKEIAILLNTIKVKTIFFAYDTEDDYEPLVNTVKLIQNYYYYNPHKLFCYVLIGFVGDTFDAARERCDLVASLGITPKAMLWHENQDKTWKRLQREYYRPEILFSKYKEYWKAA